MYGIPAVRRVLILLPLIGTLLFVGCTRDSPAAVTEQYVLGTLSRITLPGRKDPKLMANLFERLRTIERAMSAHLPQSEASRVNRQAGLQAVRVSEDTLAVVREAVEYARKTGGAFDITVGPLVTLWNIGGPDFRPPSPDSIREAVALVDYRMIEFPGDPLLFLPVPGMKLDLGAAAKGFAADELARMLRDAEVESALIDLGGNILAHGKKPDGGMWRIGIQDPFDSRGAAIGAIRASDTAVVTSGPYERFSLFGNERYHHILDPFQGHPAVNGLESVSIVAGSGLAADCLSTGAFVLGLEEGMKLVERIPGVEAVFVTAGRDIHISSGLAEEFVLLNSRFRIVD